MENANQIVLKLKTINDNLLETIQIFNTFFEGGTLPPFKVDRLKELKQIISFNSLHDIITPIENDKQLVSNITNAIFDDLWKLAIDFLDLGNFKQNDKKFNEYNVRIIQIGNEIEYYLDALDCLRSNLNSLHNFFTVFGIPFTGKWSIDKYGINLDYNDLLLEALKETDLSKRKDLILKKLHTSELFKLQNTVDKEDFDEFDNYIDRCYKAVESIDFQIKNATPPEPIKKQKSILDEKREMNEAFNNPEAIAAMEEASKNMFRKLTDKDIELVTNDCNTLNEVYVKGLDIFEVYFSNNQITTEDIQFLQTDPFSGLLSDNYFGAMVLSHFDDPVVIGTIFDICFGDTIYRIQNLDFTFCTTPVLNNEPRLKELIKIILKNNNNSVLIKDNLLSFAKQIRELIDLVYGYTNNETYIKDVNIKIFSKSNIFFELDSTLSVKAEIESKKQSVQLSDFLNDKTNYKLFQEIQDNFKDFEGKRLAILIYLLQEECKIISIISNSKTHSRKQFIQLFKDDSSFDKFQAVNKYIDPFTNELNLPTLKESDADYINIKEKLKKIIENPVA